jgi:hypothetical protein
MPTENERTEEARKTEIKIIVAGLRQAFRVDADPVRNAAFDGLCELIGERVGAQGGWLRTDEFTMGLAGIMANIEQKAITDALGKYPHPYTLEIVGRGKEAAQEFWARFIEEAAHGEAQGEGMEQGLGAMPEVWRTPVASDYQPHFKRLVELGEL